MTPKQQSKIQEKLARLAEIKAQQAELADEYLQLETETIDLFDKFGEKTVVVSELNTTITGTLVRGSTLVISEDGLQKALGAKTWAKVTKRVLDKKKLEAFTVTGEISPVLVAAHSTEKSSKPYVRLTTKESPSKEQ